MAISVYGKAKEAFISGSINYGSDTIKAALVTTSYTPNLSSDQFVSTISSNIVGTPQTLTSKSVTLGAAKAADATFSSVTSGSTVGYVVIYKDTGSSSTSPLIAVWDSASGLPYTTNGFSIVTSWASTTLFQI